MASYGFDSRSNDSSAFQDFDLAGPTLNIPVAYFLDETLYGSADSSLFLDSNRMLWGWNNEIYDKQYLSKHGTCQANGV